ncbi:MAG: glycosyltransferase family 4 protein [Bryobacterales bacterium]|nr:glycosyltransferase family 4 protein [Bryobacterales bacterium]
MLRCPAERDRFRREALDVRAGEFLLGVYGHLRETKRIGSVLAALRALRRDGLSARLLVAGAFASDDYARTMAPRLQSSDGVIVRGNTGEAEFRSLLSAADVCVNLKYPGVGESSGIAVRAMALGVPLVVSEGADPGAFPAGTVIPIPVGPAEVPALVQTLHWLAGNPQVRLGIARDARADCMSRRDPGRICAELWQWLEGIHHSASV